MADGIPVKPCCKDQKTICKDTKSTEGASDKAGEAKWKDNGCQRMLRKAAVYQGCVREQLAIKPRNISFRGKCHIFPFNLHTLYLLFLILLFLLI